MNFEYIDIQKEGSSAILFLNRSPVNDFNLQFMNEIIQAHELLAQDEEIWGVVLASANEKFFSNGLEPQYLLEADLQGRLAAFAKLFEVVKTVYAFPKPQVAAIHGFAMAGGAVLGMLPEFRIFAAGKTRFSFSEVAVGLTIPPNLLPLMSEAISGAEFYHATLLSKVFSPEEALRCGLAAEVVDKDRLLEASLNWLKRIYRLPLASYRSVKKNIRKDTLANFVDNSQNFPEFEKFLSGNFEEGLRAVLEKRRPKYVNPG